MNETKVSVRQIKILDILTLEPLSRAAISKRLQDIYPVSKTTLYRDLLDLQNKKLITSKGVGKKTTYFSLENPLTRYIDAKEYFKEGSAMRRSAKEDFDFSVFKYLPIILSKQEEKLFVPMLHKLSEKERTFDPTLFKREIERFTVEFSWKSSRIEGNTYTLLETEVLIKQMKEAKGHPRFEATMILNHKDAIDYILTHRIMFKKITLEKLFTLHTILTKDLGISSGIRSAKVAITGTNYMPLDDIKSIYKALNETIRTINAVPFPVAKAIIAASLIAYIQPFVDGNKRTSRTLANALLIAHDLYPVSYRDVDDIAYIEAILLLYEQTNLYHLKKIFLDQIRFSSENYFRI